MSKKVLHFRLDAPQYSSEFMRRGFIEAGYEYHGMNWQQVKFDEGVLGFQARAIQAAKEIEPDIIFIHIQSGDILDIETCQELTAVGFTILYTFDVREDIAWMKELAPYLNMILVADGETAKEFPAGKSFVLQSSCDMEMYKPEFVPLPEYPSKMFYTKILYNYDIAFIGSNYVNTNLNFPLADERFQMVTELKKEYGDTRYDRFLYKGMNWSTSEYVPPAKERSIYNASKIAICHNNFYRDRYSSDRLWRIIACGCFCLTKYFPGIETIFEAGTHLDWWHTIDELKLKINQYISNDEKREAIARAGSEYVRSSHNWAARVKEIEYLMGKSKRLTKLKEHGQSEPRETV